MQKRDPFRRGISIILEERRSIYVRLISYNQVNNGRTKLSAGLRAFGFGLVIWQQGGKRQGRWRELKSPFVRVEWPGGCRRRRRRHSNRTAKSVAAFCHRMSLYKNIIIFLPYSSSHGIDWWGSRLYGALLSRSSWPHAHQNRRIGRRLVCEFIDELEQASQL